MFTSGFSNASRVAGHPRRHTWAQAIIGFDHNVETDGRGCLHRFAGDTEQRGGVPKVAVIRVHVQPPDATGFLRSPNTGITELDTRGYFLNTVLRLKWAPVPGKLARRIEKTLDLPIAQVRYGAAR